MTPRHHLSDRQKMSIINDYQSDVPRKTICERYRISKSVLSRLINKFEQENTIARRPGSGRPRKTNFKTDRLIGRASKKDPTLTASQIKNDLKIENVSNRTIRRRLVEHGLHGRRPSKKPLISKKNRRARLEFAREHVNWNPKKWFNVLFSDETKVNLINSDGQLYIRRPKNEKYNPKYTVKTVKHKGGCIQVWGAFSHYGMGPLKLIEGIMTGAMYKDIMETIMLPYAEEEMPLVWVYQQDNDPKHTSALVKNWFKDNNIEVMKWPSQSPDLNPIEHIWGEVKRSLEKEKFKNKKDLFETFEKKWKSISQDIIDKYIHSMPRRCAEVIRRKGYATHY